MKKKEVVFNRSDGEAFTVNFNEQEYQRFKKFSLVYILESTLHGDKKEILGGSIKKEERVCRFCKKTHPEVKFKTEAHVITQQLNRARPISSFECDSCNEKFSQYEGDFGHYFLAERALYGIKKKQGSPKYKTKNGTLLKPDFDINSSKFDTKKGKKLKEYIQQSGSTLITIHQGKDDNEIKINNNNIEFNLQRKPYRPINIFRVFLKIGLSLLQKEDLKNYSSMFNMMNFSNFSIKHEEEYSAKEICVFIFEIPVLKNIFKYPLVHLYKKRDPSSDYVDKTLVVYFGNRIYQIPIVSDENIRQMYPEQKTIQLLKISPYINPFFSKEMFESEKFCSWIEKGNEYRLDLYRSELVKDDIQRFKIFQEKDFETL